MKVLVAGGAGFLGRAFVRHHVAAGDEVVAIDDFSAEGAFWPDVKPFESIRDDVESVLGFFEVRHNRTFDLVYHFAAPVGGRVKIEQDPLYNAKSLAIDSTFFRWAIGQSGTIVYPSSSAVYPIQYQNDPSAPMSLHELVFQPGGSADGRWGVPDEMYGFTKMAGEVLALHAAKYGLNTLCIRPFSGYGEEQSLDYPMPSICARAMRREDPLVVWGSGYQTRDFIHVDDIVGATQARLAQGIDGYQVMNIGSGVATSFVEVAQLAAEIVGYQPTITTDPAKPQGVQSRFCDPSQMLSVYEPRVSLGQGIARVIDHQAQRRP